MDDDTRELDRDVELAASEHQRLLQALDARVESGTLDVAAPSRLPNWTVGHVLTHVTNSGAGHARIFDAAAEGRVEAQYPGGVEGRAADIEAGAGRPAAEQVRALRTSILRLEQRWAESSWEGRGIGPAGEIPLTELPFSRVREVAIHHVDLDIGREFEELPDIYLRLELRRMEMLWKARQPMGLTNLPSAARDLALPTRLAWFMGRIEVPGLDPAEVF